MFIWKISFLLYFLNVFNSCGESRTKKNSSTETHEETLFKNINNFLSILNATIKQFENILTNIYDEMLLKADSLNSSDILNTIFKIICTNLPGRELLYLENIKLAAILVNKFKKYDLDAFYVDFVIKDIKENKILKTKIIETSNYTENKIKNKTIYSDQFSFMQQEITMEINKKCCCIKKILENLVYKCFFELIEYIIINKEIKTYEEKNWIKILQDFERKKPETLKPHIQFIDYEIISTIVESKYLRFVTYKRKNEQERLIIINLDLIILNFLEISTDYTNFYSTPKDDFKIELLNIKNDSTQFEKPKILLFKINLSVIKHNIDKFNLANSNKYKDLKDNFFRQYEDYNKYLIYLFNYNPNNIYYAKKNNIRIYKGKYEKL